MYDIIDAKYIFDFKIEFTFEDNSCGIVDFSIYKNRVGLFKELENLEFFKNFRIDSNLKTIVWENGLDIAPDTLYYLAIGKVPKGLEIN